MNNGISFKNKDLILIEKQVKRIRGRSDFFLKGMANIKIKLPLKRSEMLEVISMIIVSIERTQNIKLRREQIFAGYSVCNGGILDMKTGEGKTYSLIIPTIFNALCNKTTYVITTNEYLSKRDYQIVRKTLNFLEISSCFISQMDQPIEKKEKYKSKVIYTTLNNLAFDYLKDGLVYDKKECLIRRMDVAIIDEADHVMLDQALTPIIISREAPENESLLELTEKAIRRIREDELEINKEEKTIVLKESAINKIEEFLGIKGLYENEEHSDLIRCIFLNLNAKFFYQKDIDYVVIDEKIKVMDEGTGRVESDKKFETGVHQALEVKEGVSVTPGSEVISKINTYSFIRLFEKIIGASGTSWTDKNLFDKIYNLDVTLVPRSFIPNLSKEEDSYSVLMEEKLEKVILYTLSKTRLGHPVIIVTGSVRESEKISEKFLKRGINHNLLNAENIEEEEKIIENSGKNSSITISTNMIGRGTDIKVSKCVNEIGGLVVIGLNKHIQDRVEEQIIGRTARQGGKGIAKYFLSLEDEGFERNVSDKLREEAAELKNKEKITDRKLKRTIDKMINYLKGVRKGNFDFDLSRQLISENVYEGIRSEIYKKRMNALRYWDMSFYINPMLKSWLKRKEGLVELTEIDEEFEKILSLTDVNKQEIEEVFNKKEMERIFKRAYKQLVAVYIKNRQGYSLIDEYTENQKYLMMIDNEWVNFLKSVDLYDINQGIKSYNNEDQFYEKQKTIEKMAIEFNSKVEDLFIKNTFLPFTERDRESQNQPTYEIS